MPELPEVTTTANELDKLISKLTVKDVWTSYSSLSHKGKDNIKNPKFFSKFKKAVIGEKVLKVYRRGKNVLIDISGGKTILVHMKMTGHLLYGTYSRRLNVKGQMSKVKTEKSWEKEEWVPDEKENSPLWDPFNRFIRFVITFSNGKNLVLSDMRKFAKVTYFPTAEKETVPDLKTIGPEPLETNFQLSNFNFQLKKKPNLPIKQVLMMPEIIAGIGNIYSDEMLWLSDIHPESKSRKVPDLHLKHLFLSMKIVLQKGIDLKGDSMSDYRNPNGEKGGFQHKHNAYRKTGEKCGKKGCKGTVKKIKIGGRSAHFCDTHQCKYI